ncbi:MAG: MBOAT family O-acyltransferase [Planctomycetota bacterium]
MIWFWLAFISQNAAALGFLFVVRRGRMIAWLLCSGVILVAPCWIPLNMSALRFLSCVVAVTLLWKTYDAYRNPALAAGSGVKNWILYLPNWFWFVLKRVPRNRPARSDWRRVAVEAPLMIAWVALCVLLLRFDWSDVPFAIEHTAKVVGFATAMMLIGRWFAALYRRTAGPAMDPIDHLFTARTPAEFWRRWNRPFRDFFDEHIFRPIGGARRPVFATLIVFAVSGLMHEYVFGVATGRVQGWQILFFMVQGCAAAATIRIRPTGWAAGLWWARTMAFNLATTVLFCQSVDEVISFYQR